MQTTAIASNREVHFGKDPDKVSLHLRSLYIVFLMQNKFSKFWILKIERKGLRKGLRNPQAVGPMFSVRIE